MMSQDEVQGSVEDRLELCEQKIGYQFSDRALLQAALTHASGADCRANSNERLEFLGDAILGFVVCEKLFREFPDYQEGELTKLKSVVVSRNTCARLSKQLELADLLILGKGLSNHRAVPNSLLADVFEALIAAIFLDGGVQPARDFLERFLAEEIRVSIENGTTENFKSILQQYSQKEYGEPPAYLLVREYGPDHNKNFEVVAKVDGRQFEAAKGRNKKEAEQKAAHNALRELDQID